VLRLAKAQSRLTLSDDWDGVVWLLPFAYRTSGTEDIAIAACAALLERHFVDRRRIEQYFERLPRRLHRRVLARILEHAEAGARNRVLEEFARHLSPEDLARVSESLGAIGDEPVVSATLAV
jgi:hypothetical protein